MRVSEIMTQNPACCTPDSTLSDVARMMKDNDCGCIPVVNNRIEMKPVGTITDRDITIRTVAARQNPVDMRASDIMTTDIATVSPQTTLEECLDVMEDKEIRRVLVVDERARCCGIIAQADVIQSGVNPLRTNKVIREISESPAYRNRGFMAEGRRSNESRFGYRSFMNAGTLMPLLIGLGSGMALKYWMDTRQNSQKNSDSRAYRNRYETEYIPNAVNEMSFGKYADADPEVERRQNELESRFQSARNEAGAAAATTDTGTNSLDREDETVTSRDKGRSANQGGRF